MFPASSKKPGTVLGFPDVCKTPLLGVPVPTAYPNISKLPVYAKSQITKTQGQKKEGQKKVSESQQELTKQIAKAAASFQQIEARHMNTLGFDVNALKQYAQAMQEAIQAAQKLQQSLFQAASATVAHCECKRTLQSYT